MCLLRALLDAESIGLKGDAALPTGSLLPGRYCPGVRAEPERPLLMCASKCAVLCLSSSLQFESMLPLSFSGGKKSKEVLFDLQIPGSLEGICEFINSSDQLNKKSNNGPTPSFQNAELF